MPHLLRWWNAQVATFDKASAALDWLETWNAPFVVPVVPHPPVPNRWSAVCEAQGGHHSYGILPAGIGLSVGFGSAWSCPSKPLAWMAVRARGDHQYGYLGFNAPPRPGPFPVRMDKGHPGSWGTFLGRLFPWGDNLEEVYDALTGTTYRRPTAKSVRRYEKRRELVVGAIDADIDVYWYHALSGGHAGSVYDHADALRFMVERTEARGPDHVGVLFGDLNLDPWVMRELIQNCFGPVAAPGSNITVAPGSFGIVATNLFTHKNGHELDYGVIYNGRTAHLLLGGRAVHAVIERGVPPGTVVAVGNPVTIPSVPPLGLTSDHYPVRLWLDH